MEASLRYYRPSSFIDGTRDHRTLQMAAAAGMAAGAYYCHSGGYLYRDTVRSNPVRYQLGAAAGDLDNVARLVKDATSRPSRNFCGAKARSSTDSGSTPDSARLRDLQSPYHYAKTASPGDWMDREAVELELEGRKMLKQGVVEGENLGARKMPENDGERGGVEAGREDRSVVVEQKPVLRFPWMKKTKSHAHQWKAQWIGENKE